MGWAIDHAAIAARDLQESVRFYERFFGIRPAPIKLAYHPENPISPDRVAILVDGLGSSIHLIDGIINFHAEFPNFEHDPTAPHVALSTDDVDAVEARFHERGWKYMPPRDWGPTGFARLYTEDPLGNLIEVCGRTSEAAETGVSGTQQAQDLDWYLEHVTLTSVNLERSSKWLTDFLDMNPDEAASRPDVLVYSESGRTGLRVRLPEPTVESAAAPSVLGYFGISVRDLAAVEHAVVQEGFPYWSESERDSGERTILVFDPSLNLIEIRQHG